VATIARGSYLLSSTTAVTGLSVTSHSGLPTAVIGGVMAGQAITTAQGNFAKGTQKGLTGIAINALLGDFVGTISKALDGYRMVATEGHLLLPGEIAFALTGFTTTISQEAINTTSQVGIHGQQGNVVQGVLTVTLNIVLQGKQMVLSMQRISRDVSGIEYVLVESASNKIIVQGVNKSVLVEKEWSKIIVQESPDTLITH